MHRVLVGKKVTNADSCAGWQHFLLSYRDSLAAVCSAQMNRKKRVQVRALTLSSLGHFTGMASMSQLLHRITSDKCDGICMRENL